MVIKVTATQRPLPSFVFYQKRSICTLKTTTDQQYIASPLYLPPYRVSPVLLGQKLTRALDQHQKVKDVTLILLLKELEQAQYIYMFLKNPALWEAAAHRLHELPTNEQLTDPLQTFT